MKERDITDKEKYRQRKKGKDDERKKYYRESKIQIEKERE